MVVLPIGGADMPVVISMLNAFTGLSAAAAGMALDNTALIVGGMIVGASGSILTNLMAKAMNRSIGNIVMGGFGGAVAAPAGGADAEGRTVTSTSADDVAIQLSYASQVIVVPGYGMAVAQAQHAVRELSEELEKRGVEVKFAIHPVAGRMPGHMNVLLAEADVPYEQLKEMDEINNEFSRTDVSLVIGANDVTNPAARTQADSPIYGMPILNVDESGAVIVLKRSMASGFAGIDNPLFYDDKTSMLFGDAKESITVGARRGPGSRLHHSRFPAERLARERRETSPCACPSWTRRRRSRRSSATSSTCGSDGAIDQVLVVDGGSTDGTAELARQAGAEVLLQAQLLPGYGPVAGKGDAMWRALTVLRGDIVVFVDGDSGRFGPHFACGLAGPILFETRASNTSRATTGGRSRSAT